MTSTNNKLKVATSQFTISADISRNANHITNQMRQAHKQNADIIHFPETALSGYAGSDFISWRNFDWKAQENYLCKIRDLAKKLKLWVILGVTHSITNNHNKLPYNSLYLINSSGKIIDRYDKCFCTSTDLRFYSPGDHLVTFTINNIKCALLICFDIRFPEIFRAYEKQDVQAIFHSFYNARQPEKNILSTVIPATLEASAASNYTWISAANSTGRVQLWPAHFIQPNGLTTSKLRLHQPNILINTINTTIKLYDPTKHYRRNAASDFFKSISSN